MARTMVPAYKVAVFMDHFFFLLFLHSLAQKAQDQARKYEPIATCVTTMAVNRLK